MSLLTQGSSYQKVCEVADRSGMFSGCTWRISISSAAAAASSASAASDDRSFRSGRPAREARLTAAARRSALSPRLSAVVTRRACGA